MTNIKKKIVATACACTLVLGGSLTALAATDEADQVFYGWLGGGQATTEFSTVEKQTRLNSIEINIVYFDETNCAYMWAESPLGRNYSDPDQAVAEGYNTIYYDTIPNVGSDVVLNGRNAFDVSNNAWVRGYWTPN